MIKYILLSLFLGGIAGYLNDNWGTPAINTLVSDYLFNFSLIALLFVMGLAFG